jgi:short-subunit dehydrogenase
MNKEKIVWITGASSGIGKATAIELANRGYTVAITARRVELLREISLKYTNVYVYSGDVTDRESIKDLVERIESELGAIDIAILNAGGIFKNNKGDMFGESYRDTFELNYFGTLNCLEPLVVSMTKRNVGHIAIMTSISGYGGLPLLSPAYTSSKAALINLCESLVTKLVKKNIKLQMIAPGFVHSDLNLGNKIVTPFIMSAEKAAVEICDGLVTNKFEIAFPKYTAVLYLKLLNMLPYCLYFWVLKISLKIYRMLVAFK